MSNSTTDRPAIATTQTYCDYSELTQSDRTTIARVLTWDIGADVQAQEAIRIVNEGAAIVEQLKQKLEKSSKKIEIGKNYPLGQQVQLLGTVYPVCRDWNSQVVNGKPSLGAIQATDEENEVAA